MLIAPTFRRDETIATSVLLGGVLAVFLVFSDWSLFNVTTGGDRLMLAVENAMQNGSVNEPPTEDATVRPALVYLVSTGRLAEFSRSVALVCQNFPHAPKYDLLFVSFSQDPDLAAAAKTVATVAAIGQNCSFRSVRHVVINTSLWPSQDQWESNIPLKSYKMMIWFWLYGILYDPALREYTHIMRMDTDSLLLSPMADDPARALVRARALIGYHCFSWDGGVPGLDKLIDEVLKERPPADPTFEYPPGDRSPMFYSNFLVLDRARLAGRPEIADFLRRVLPGIIAHRWGDAPLWADIAGIFLAQREVLHLNDFTYNHGRGRNFLTLPNNTMTIGWNFNKWKLDKPPGADNHCWDSRLLPYCVFSELRRPSGSPECPYPTPLIQ